MGRNLKLSKRNVNTLNDIYKMAYIDYLKTRISINPNIDSVCFYKNGNKVELSIDITGSTSASTSGSTSGITSGSTSGSTVIINKHTVTYKIDGKVYKTFENIEYGAPIPSVTNPTKVGYTFSGWGWTPETMPDKNLEINATFIINKHTVTYKVDGSVYKTFENIEYGAPIPNVGYSTKVGYTFSGWGEIPTTMPDYDVVITGDYIINKHTVTYKVDGEIHKIINNVEYGSVIPTVTEPSKIGYTFSGWSEIPTTMPDKDVVVTGAYSINKYKLNYYINGNLYSSVTYEYSSQITIISYIPENGYTFSGWKNVPTTMPDKDVNVYSTLIKNSHTVTYKVDGSTYQTFENVEYGSVIPTVEEPSKIGYTFSGWSEIPTTMPDADVIITGSYTINKHTVTYIVNGETYGVFENIEYSSAIPTVGEPSRICYTFSGWSEIPTTMPDYDVNIYGYLNPIIIGNIDTDNKISVDTTTLKEGNVYHVKYIDYDDVPLDETDEIFNFTKPIVIGNIDEDNKISVDTSTLKEGNVYHVKYIKSNDKPLEETDEIFNFEL